MVVTGQCSSIARNVSADNGTITSPNYPSSYPNYASCVWRITAPSTGYVSIYTECTELAKKKRNFFTRKDGERAKCSWLSRMPNLFSIISIAIMAPSMENCSMIILILSEAWISNVSIHPSLRLIQLHGVSSCSSTLHTGKGVSIIVSLGKPPIYQP